VRVERARRGVVPRGELAHGEEDLVEAAEARVRRKEARRGGAVQELRPDGLRLREVPGLGARDHESRRVVRIRCGGS